MKKLIFLTSFVVVSIFLYVGCKKTDENLMPKSVLNNSEPPVTLGNIRGKIILPNSSTLDVNTLKVETPISNSTVTDSAYDVTAYISEFNSLLVVDNSSKVILIGYDYPEQTDKNISITTTAVALVMNTPAVLSLSKEGKLSLIERIKADDKFQDLENEVKANVLLNKDLFDSTNNVLFQKIELLLTSASNKKNRSMNDAVLFQQLEPNNNFKFYNDGKRVISSVVGVYKDNERITEIVVEGINFMPTSIQDITSLDFAAVSAPPDPIYYTLTGNGQYEFKARTGRPDSYENSDDFKNAFLLNIQKMSLGLLKPFLPKLKSNSLSCFVKPSEIIYDLYKIKNHDITALTFEVVQQMLSSAEEIEECVSGNTNLFNSSYFPSMQKYFKRLEVLFLPASAFNQTLFGIQWATIHPTMDKCYIKNDNSTHECGSIGIGEWSELGGDNKSSFDEGNIGEILIDKTNHIYLSGYSNVSGQSYVAKWDGSNWTQLPKEPSLMDYTYNIYLDKNDNLYASANKGLGDSSFILKWGGTQWNKLGNSFNGPIYSFASSTSGTLYVGGRFNLVLNAGPTVAKWDGLQWKELGDSNIYFAPISNLFVDNSGSVYAGPLISGLSSNLLVKYNGVNWSEFGNNPPAWGTGVFVDSKFNFLSRTNFTTGGRIHKYNGTVWNELGNNSSTIFNNDINTAVTNLTDEIYVAGKFHSNWHPYVVKFDGNNWVTIGSNPFFFNDDINTLAIDKSGKVYAAGWFRNSNLKPFVAVYK